MKALRIPGTLLLSLLDKGIGAVIAISDFIGSRKSKKQKFEELVEKQGVDRHAPTVVLKRPPPPPPPRSPKD